MEKKDYLKKLDEFFKNAHPSWLFIKDTANKFIEEYCKNSKLGVYTVNVSNEEKRLYFDNNLVEIIFVLKKTLQEAGIKCKEKVLFNFSDSFIKIETEVE